MNELKIVKTFACDHRNNIKWSVPFIRLGAKNSDACLNIKDDEMQKFDPCASEGSQILYVYKHLEEFGQFDYIGFSHYRMFLSTAKPNYGVFPICNAKIENTQDILTDKQQSIILTKTDFDGILPTSFIDFSYAKDCKTVQDMMWAQSNYFKTHFFNIQILHSRDEVETAFNILLENTPDIYKDNMKKSFNIIKTYHFNIFTLKKELFEIYGKIILPTFETLFSIIKQDDIDKRWLGYLLERFTSCVLIMFILSDKKFIETPVIVFEK